MIKFSTNKNNVIIELDDLTATAMIEVLDIAAKDMLHANLPDDKQLAFIELHKQIRKIFYKR